MSEECEFFLFIGGDYNGEYIKADSRYDCWRMRVKEEFDFRICEVPTPKMAAVDVQDYKRGVIRSRNTEEIVFYFDIEKKDVYKKYLEIVHFND